VKEIKMIKSITILLFIAFLSSCAANKKAHEMVQLPSCLATKIKDMAADPGKGSPLSVTRYTYRGQTVYYMVSPCCDKYNVVYDSACAILGYPDGGFTGRGDGNMPGFKNEALNGKVVWKNTKAQ
jgi:Domain of unknown function (DUF6970)